MSKPTLRGRLKAVAADSCQLLNSPSTGRIRITNLPMITESLVLLAFMATASFVRSQNEPSADSRESSPIPPASSTTARILGDIPDGTPPPPLPPKAEFHIPAGDILSTTHHEQGGRTITIQKIKPIALPPPPVPVAQPYAVPDSEFSGRLADYREAHPKSGLLFIGATVFRSKDSPPRTLVRYWPEGKGETITFWSSADFALIAGGINSYADSSDNTHYLLMGWGNVDIDRMADLRTAQDLEYDAPAMPEFPDGKASFEIIGNQPAAEDLVPIQSLHDLYNNEYERLKTAWEGRERARIQQEAELKANPPRPKNLTLNFWRTEKPAAAKGGAK